MIYIFGGINLDVVAKINGKAHLYESNIANISLRAGGVGRNIARAIGNYSKCEFLTCIPNNLYNSVVSDLERNNVSLKYSKYLNDIASLNMYLDIIDSDGVVIGACDTKALLKFDESDIKNVLSIIKDDDIVVIDANIPELAEYIVNNSKGFKMMDGVSSVKLERIKHFVNKLDFIKVNNLEYNIVKDRLPKNYLITNGHGGKIVYKNQELVFDHKELTPVNPTGCGDTFLGTFIGNMDKPLKEAITLSIIAAAASSQIDEAVPTISEIDRINKKDLNIIWME